MTSSEMPVRPPLAAPRAALLPKTDTTRLARAGRWLGRILACASLCLLLGPVPAWAADGGPRPRALLLQVRDTAPGTDHPNFLRERNGAYTVSTGSGGDVDERASANAANNSMVVSTTSSVRLVRLREGEPVRVDLPAVQTLQFHVPTGKGGAAPRPKAGASATQPPTGSAPGASGASTPAASSVVFYEAVTAFAARFALVGSGGVRIDLVPLQVGTVAAPFAVGPGGESMHPVVLFGRLGEWIALGDADLVSSGKTLTPTAEPPSLPSVWVRVVPDTADRP
ncbi:MAG TPA: hypothetical protein VEI05_00685 [Burkholderiaceae bacterium]|nr:hypothetical protein [Burkholderiaceae bacterium]